MIELKSLGKIYSNEGVLTSGLHNINLSLKKGEIVAIVGESGSGKSTLLNVITKMDTFEEGEYYYYGNETSFFDVSDNDTFRKEKVGFIFQNYNILDSYTVLENVMLPLMIDGMKRSEAKKRALELINEVGLSHRIKNRGVQLSGGEKQRCVIARALASNCEILACDEPTGNLDSNTGKDIINLIKKVAKDKLVLIVSHNEAEVDPIITRKIRMKDGGIIEDIEIEQVEDEVYEKEEEISLEYKPLKTRNRIRLALLNLINTPKRTILSSLIIVSVCVFAIVLYQAIFFLMSDIKISPFTYQGDNKVIVYRDDGQEVNISDLGLDKNQYCINGFYYDTTFSTNIISGYYGVYGYEPKPADLKLTGGEMPKNELECVVLNNYDSGRNKDIIGEYISDFYFNEFVCLNVPKIKVTGYEIRNDISNDNMIAHNDIIENLMKISSALNTCYSIEGYHRESIVFDYNLEHTKVVQKNNVDSFQFNDIFVKNVHDLKINFDDIPVEIDNTATMTKLYIGQDFIDLIEEHPYEVSCYPNNVELFTLRMKAKGYSVINVATYDTTPKLALFLMRLVSFFTMIYASAGIVLIYFITYLILSRVFSSKQKEYAIMRTIGVAKKDMRYIVQFELLSQCILMSVLVYATFAISGMFAKTGFFAMFTKLPMFVTILYFGVIIFFGFLLAKRFNRRLFHFSAQSSLKGGKVK